MLLSFHNAYCACRGHSLHIHICDTVSQYIYLFIVFMLITGYGISNCDLQLSLTLNYK